MRENQYVSLFYFFFRCDDTTNPLTLEESRYFHPSRDRWQKVHNRPTAWRLEPNSYIWLPSAELFREKNHPFPKEFVLFITLRLHNVSEILFESSSKIRPKIQKKNPQKYE